MDNELPTLAKKNITKLLDSSYRSKIITSFSAAKLAQLQIESYAKQIVKNQQTTKSMPHLYPFQILTCITSNGKFNSKIFEMNIVNHFINEDDEQAAVEVAECMCILWYNADKSIIKFQQIAQANNVQQTV